MFLYEQLLLYGCLSHCYKNILNIHIRVSARRLNITCLNQVYVCINVETSYHNKKRGETEKP